MLIFFDAKLSDQNILVRLIVFVPQTNFYFRVCLQIGYIIPSIGLSSCSQSNGCGPSFSESCQISVSCKFPTEIGQWAVRLKQLETSKYQPEA